MQTAEQVRKQVEAAKAEAARRFDQNMGAGAYDRLAEYRAANNAKALDSICAAIKRDPA